MKFKVGNKIIGNEKAKKYAVTKPGTVWYVGSITFGNLNIGPQLGMENYLVDPEYFDLLYSKNKRKAPSWL